MLLFRKQHTVFIIVNKLLTCRIEEVKDCILPGSQDEKHSTRRKNRKDLSCVLVLPLFFFGFFSILHAEDIEVSVKEYTEESNNNDIILDTVHVKSVRDPQRQYNISIPVTTIDDEYLKENMFTSMVDLLDSIPGFSTLYDYHSPVYMRGFSGNNILFLQDGCLRISTTPKGTRANKLNAFNIEEIEIIKGPGSVLYGSGALTGIVNIKTRDIFREKGLSAETQAGYSFNDNEKELAAMLNYNTGSAAVNFSARRRVADDYTLPGGEKTERRYLEDNDFTGKFGFLLPGDQKIIFSSDVHLGGPWSKPAGFNGKPNMQIYYDREDAYHFSAFYEKKALTLIDALQVNAYYDQEYTESGKRKYSALGSVTEDDATNMKDAYGGLNLLLEKSIGNNKIAAGIDSTIFRIWIDTSSYSTIIAPEPVTTEADSIQGGGTDTIGVFLQDKISFKNTELIIGLRYDIARVTEGDHHDDSMDSVDAYSSEKEKAAVSGNIGFLYRITETLSWNFNAGRAFRMPNYSEMYCETVTGKGIVSGDPALEPEYSYNLDMGLSGWLGIFRFSIDTFINFYDDLIAMQPVDSPYIDYIYRNVDAARIYGFETELSCKLEGFPFNDSVLIPSISWTYYLGDVVEDNEYLDFSEGTSLGYVPNSELHSSLRLTKKIMRFSLFFDFGGTYAFRQDRVPEGDDPYDAYYFLEAKTGVAVNSLMCFKKVKIYLTVKNISDNEYYLCGGYLPAKGRDIRISFNAKI